MHPTDSDLTEISMLDHSTFPLLCVNAIQQQQHQLDAAMRRVVPAYDRTSAHVHAVHMCMRCTCACSTQLLPHLLTCLLTYLLACILTYLLPYILTYLHTPSLPPSLPPSLTHSLTQASHESKLAWQQQQLDQLQGEQRSRVQGPGSSHEGQLAWQEQLDPAPWTLAWQQQQQQLDEVDAQRVQPPVHVHAICMWACTPHACARHMHVGMHAPCMWTQ